MLIIDDSTPNDVLFPAGFARGYVERDYSLYPREMFDPPTDMKLIPRSEWDARIEEQERLQSSLEHIRMASGPNGGHIPSMDQNGHGYCWTYSTGMSVQLIRAVQGQPYVRLNPHAVGAIVKGGRDEGGWCGLSAKFLREVGIPSEEFWPGHSLSLSNDTAAMRDSAALHKVTEEWVDLTRAVYDQTLTFDQVATCLLLGLPCALDFNWWAHSVCGIRLVKVEAGSYGIKILNSWTDNWEEKGMAVLRGEKAIPNGALCIRTTKASMK